MFNKLDADTSGAIGDGELGDLLRALDMRASQARIESLMRCCSSRR